MLFIDVDAYLPPTYDLPAQPARPALVREERSPYWTGLLAGNLFAPLPQATPQPAPTQQAGNQQETVHPGVTVRLIDEGIDPQGKWYQTFRLTIRPGGTMSDAAFAIYGDINRSEEVFRAAQRQNPNLTDPTRLFVGQEIDITIDPATVAVFKEHRQPQDSPVRETVYYNRIVETVYREARDGVLRTIDFPADDRTDRFVFSSFLQEEESIEAKPGARVIDYRYVAGQAFGDVVNNLFGVLSAKAANELVAQTQWDPNNWPPAEGAQARIVVDTRASYEDVKPAVTDFAPADPAALARWQELTRAREAAGIYPVRVEREGIVYHVLVGRSTVTAKQVSQLLFNNEDNFLQIATAAGISLPSEDTESLPAGYDPLLIGRSFEVQVPFVQEYFPVSENLPAEDGSTVTRLANGTVIYDYPVAEGESGLIRVVQYPNGYKSITSRPGDFTLLALDFIHFQFLNLASPDMPREEREQLSRDFQARMLWNWSRGIPRSASDVAEDLRMRVSEDDVLLEVVTYQRESVPLHERLMFELWFTYPIVVVVLVVVIGTVVLFAVSWQARKVQVNRRRRFGRGL